MSAGTRAADVRAFDEARAAGDADAMAAAALRLAGGQVWGTMRGRIPAFLHQAYAVAEGRQRVQLAVAIARAWAYGGSADRASEFADEALAGAEQLDDPTLLAQALDAQLLVRWGPDQLDERVAISSRLEETVAHVVEPEARMSAYVWRLTVAVERLDVPVMRRQLRALEELAEDAGEARQQMFAASRRAMYALLVGDLELAHRMRVVAVEAGTTAGEPDAYALERALSLWSARQSGDTASLAAEAALYEEFGEREGVLSVSAQATQLWTCLGEHERARGLLHQLAGRDFSGIPRDVDWMLTMTALTETAAAVGAHDLLANAVRLLTPYAGRGVTDAGAVAFAGVVDHYVAMALTSMGDDTAAQWWEQARDAYRRIGAQWWLSRCVAVPQPRSSHLYLRPVAGDMWEVGRDGAVQMLRDMKGMHYLRLLLQRPRVDVPALTLSDAVAGHPGVSTDEASLGPALDRAAATAYRNRLAELDAEIDESRSWRDDARTVGLERERDALLDQLRSAAGLAGRDRESGASAERARVAVRKAVSAALRRIDEVDPSLGRLLGDTVTTGAVCRYEPDPDRPADWVLD